MVSPYFFLEKTDDLFSHRPLESDDLFSCRLLTTPIVTCRLSSVIFKFRHEKNNFIRVYLLDGITRNGSPTARLSPQ